MQGVNLYLGNLEPSVGFMLLYIGASSSVFGIMNAIRFNKDENEYLIA